ncbi:metallophosphoesterase [Parvularcula marina]|uniref:metallophosphoesterase family protein n=1 Tax=Parvularcula marina TaxID=2292771 RepID=UPI00351501B5
MNITRLAHVADLHFGALDKAALDVFTSFIQSNNVEGIVISGDLTQRGSHHEFEQFKAWSREVSVPLICVPGNHDTPMYSVARRAISPFRRYNSYTDHIPGSGTFGSFQVEGLNTARGWQFRLNWAEGSVRQGDLTELLSRYPKDSDTISVIACHHPFLSPPSSPLRIRTRRGVWASRAVADSKVSLLLAGHVHTPTTTWRGTKEKGYLSVTSGTLSQRLRRHPPSFNLISLYQDKIEIEAVMATEAQAGHRKILGTWPRQGSQILPHPNR